MRTVQHGWSRVIRTAALGLVLGLVALVVPDSAVTPAQMSLVKMQRAQGVDVSPDVIWILGVGSDAREGQPRLRSRGDAIQLVGINTRTGAATAIGIARDSWVPIPGVGTNRVNSALFFGGPQLMGRTVGNMVGIQPDYVFVTGFGGFHRMVDSIGGITVDSAHAFSDSNLRPKRYRNGFPRGKVKLDGEAAHVFVRVRKSLPKGDFDRSANQQRALRGIHRKIHANASKPGFIERGVLSAVRNLDTNLPPAELFRLAQAVAQVKPNKVTACVVPGRTGMAGSASVVFADVGVARRYGNDARKDATISRC
ncbi:LCP family protein [Nocardioides sp.]|uniref:LCP family protein n=1 Tax=Nocardioides sp. TaxID=35761 RepID=UPI002736DA10|nr:LCP family protein [Nocardioides sp.]MDP3891177.1 LCP family protein [Nocardioides sp.]